VQLSSLSDELEALGGSTRVSRYDVCLLVGPRPEGREAPSIVRRRGAGVVVRDPRAPADTPSGQCERSFALPAVFDAHADPAHAALAQHVSQRVASDLVNGFNASVVAFGQSGTGKTHALLGACAWPAAGAPPVLPAIVAAVIELTAIHGFDTFQLGVSCWELAADQVVDLLAPEPLSAVSPNLHLRRIPGLCLEHTCLKVESVADLNATLAFARSRSCNWAPSGGSQHALPNRAHSFVRVVLHNKQHSWLSLLHVVDLAGDGLEGLEGHLRVGVDRLGADGLA